MGPQTELRRTDGMLEVKCTGKYTQADLLGVVDAIAAVRGRDPEVTKFLIDALKAEIELGGIGEYFVGEYAAKRLIGTRISLLTAPGQVTKLLENAAYNRGLKFLTTSCREEAEAWLAD